MEVTSHILIVDDDKDVRELLSKFLMKHGLRVTVAMDVAEARKHLKTGSFDLVVLDIKMPGEDGLSLCRYLCGTCTTPVLMLTGVSDELDRVLGLELGADDYVVKPFAQRELLARIRAILRRVNSLPPAPEAMPGKKLKFHEMVFSYDSRELLNQNNIATVLSYSEYLLLSAFVHRPNIAMTREQLLDLTKGRAANLFDRTIDNQVSRLRRKIGDDPKNPKIIQTIWGGGYKFVGSVELVAC